MGHTDLLDSLETQSYSELQSLLIDEAEPEFCKFYVQSNTYDPL